MVGDRVMVCVQRRLIVGRGWQVIVDEVAGRLFLQVVDCRRSEAEAQLQ